MKILLALLLFIISFPVAAQSEQVKPQLLKEPAGWAFERFSLPPVFAPNFPFSGFEELRFSPGMFNKDSTDYFTYAFVAQLDNTTGITQNDISNYLFNYFKGLCSSTAVNRKLVVDTSKIYVAVAKKKAIPGNDIYNATLNVFGVFADGAPVKLNMEVKVLIDTSTKKTYLLFITSPQEKNHLVWKELYKIQKNFVVPG